MSECKFYIRDVSSKDYKELLSVLCELSKTEMDEETFSKFMIQRGILGISTLVATDKKTNAVVGTASYFLEPKFLHGGSYVVHIEDVAVLKEYQGQGIAQELISTIKRFAEKWGAYKTILNCSEELEHFYGEKLDFYKSAIQMRYNT